MAAYCPDSLQHKKHTVAKPLLPCPMQNTRSYLWCKSKWFSSPYHELKIWTETGRLDLRDLSPACFSGEMSDLFVICLSGGIFWIISERVISVYPRSRGPANHPCEKIRLNRFAGNLLSGLLGDAVWFVPNAPNIQLTTI